ncbi:MAG: hypothetical protein QM286_12650 [Acidobacteriota bacterium]|nr:hypothetical protein [Acidobacteriota bacterium]
MTTVADILAASDEAMDEIWRDDNGYVSIQDLPPWTGYFGGTYVQHCGISVCRVYYKAGLTMGVDFPDLSYTPTGAAATFDLGMAVDVPQPGDWGIIDWGGNGWGATGESDHAVLIIDTSNWPDYVVTREWNTTSDGRGADYQRAPGLFTVFGRPRLTTTPPPIEPPAAVPFTEYEDDMNVYVGGMGAGQWFLQAGGNLVPVSKGDVVLKTRQSVNVINCSDAFIQRLAKALPVVR